MGAEPDVPPRWSGTVLETTARVVTWNVWGRYGPWREREAAIASTLASARPTSSCSPRRGRRRRTVAFYDAWAGAGHPVAAGLLGTRVVHGVHPSDHYGVWADVRY